MARMILLGVGTSVPDADRGHTHMVWESGGEPFLIDAGGSTYQRLLKVGIDPQTLRGVLLTHSHLDHINGLFSLVFSLYLAGRQTLPLPIYGLPSTLAIVQQILAAFELGKYVAPLEWTPVQPGETLVLAEGWKLRLALNEHVAPCLALRFEKEEKSLVYSGDTPPCQAVIDLAHGADVLLHEATSKEPSSPHSTPRQAGEVAQQAGVQKLFLVHFSPYWTMPEAEALAEVQAGGFRGEAELGQEGQVIEV